MCGGVGFKIKNIPDEELKKYYSPDMIKRFKSQDRIESFFWNTQPVLPVKSKQGTKLLLWGNKDENIKLPKTGWAKKESIEEGKWNYLHPEPVEIPIDSGYEKKTWFDMPGGTKGIVVKRGGETEHVYMITQPASEEYKKETGHDREPPGEKKHYEHNLAKDIKI